MWDRVGRCVCTALLLLVWTSAAAQQIGPASGSLVMAGGGNDITPILQKFFEIVTDQVEGGILMAHNAN